ncbi:hypothetical protein [Priestia megaterium]|uniref:hypothetical protein n=1 Tax=Priestia megaterium TaxID=1404 RepID=UPI00372D2333
MIIIKKYYFHYNDKDDKYYVEKAYPCKKKSHDDFLKYKKEQHQEDDPEESRGWAYGREEDSSEESHVWTYGRKEDLYEESHDWACKYKEDKGKKGSTRESAFRALNLTMPQNVPADTFVKAVFPTEQFDLANEYNPITSTFRPKKDGVYSLIATVGFSPNDQMLDYRTRIEIRVNGTTAIAIDNDFFGGNTPFVNAVSVSTIYNLEAGDRVEVFVQSSIPGTIVTSEDGSHFEAARFPSPTND